MKHYGLQVKEIPIIFRATLEAGESSEGDAILENRELNFRREWANGYKSALPDNFSTFPAEGETIIIMFDGVMYESTVRRNEHEGSTGFQFGAPFVSSYGFDFTDMPIFGAYNPESDLTFCTENSGLHEVGLYFAGASTPSAKILSADLTGNGQINHFRARFACGENGTLHLKPYVILNGNIRIDLCNFAQGGDQYIAGDNEEIEFDCYVPIETHAVAYVEAENTGEYPSLVDAAMTVQYEDFIESESIVGYEGVNLRRGRR